MKTIKYIGLFIAILSLTPSAFAQKDGGYGMGNGGDAVVCYTDSTRSTITSVQMFDYWEQEQVLHFGKVDLGASSLSVQDKIQMVVYRIAKFDPVLAEEIKSKALNLANNIQNYLATSYQLPEIDDANPKVIPTQKNCFIEQYGVQYKDVITGQRRFLISDKFYNFPGTSNDDKAGLILHEAIYRYAILQNSVLNNSDGVRYFNYIVASKKIESLALFDINPYVTYLKIAGIFPLDCKVVDGVYLISTSWKSRAYFNQIIKIGSDIEILLPRSATIEYSSYSQTFSFSRDEDYNFKNIPSIIFNITDKNGLKNSYSTNYSFSVKQSPSEQLISFYYSSAMPGSQLKFFTGPLNRTYSCYGGTYDRNLQIMTDCYTSDLVNYNGEQYKFYYIRNEASGLWSVYNNNYSKFNILGSTKNLKIIPYRDNGLNSHIVVDNNLNIIEANIDSDSPYQIIKENKNFPVIVNGSKLFIGEHMKINVINGVYTLTFVTAEQEYKKPTIKNMRLINTNDPLLVDPSIAAYNYCKKMGYNGGGEYASRSEYIGFNGEQFFDLATDNVIYKTDEDVRVIDYVKCDAYEETVTDY